MVTSTLHTHTPFVHRQITPAPDTIYSNKTYKDYTRG